MIVSGISNPLYFSANTTSKVNGSTKKVNGSTNDIAPNVFSIDTFEHSDSEEINYTYSITIEKPELPPSYLLQNYPNDNYSDMTDIEVYRSIFDKYCDVYGDDFFYSENSVLGFPLHESDKLYIEANGSFTKELIEQFGSYENARSVFRKSEYGDMTNTEIRSKIFDEFSTGSSMTNEDFMRMTYKMSYYGVDDGLRLVAEQLSKPMNFFGNKQEALENFKNNLKAPLNMQDMKKIVDGMLYTGSISSTTYVFIKNIF